MENVRISFKQGMNVEKENIIECNFFCESAEPKQYHSEIQFVSNSPFHLEIVNDSAYMYSSLDGLDGGKGKKLSKKVFEEEGACIGFAYPDGKMRGGRENRITVSIKVHVIREEAVNLDDYKVRFD